MLSSFLHSEKTQQEVSGMSKWAAQSAVCLAQVSKGDVLFVGS